MNQPTKYKNYILGLNKKPTKPCTPNPEPEEPTNPEDPGDPNEEEIGLLNGLEIADNAWSPKTLTYFGQRTRSLLISGPIDSDMSCGIMSQIFSLNSESDEPITLYINSEGGEVSQAFAIYDTMKSVPSPIITLAFGECMSAGLLLLQGGDYRVAMPNTRFFYHEPIAAFQVRSSREVASINEYYNWCEQRGADIIRTRSKIPMNIWKSTFQGQTGLHFDIAFALKHKIIDQTSFIPKKIKLIIEGMKDQKKDTKATKAQPPPVSSKKNGK